MKPISSPVFVNPVSVSQLKGLWKTMFIYSNDKLDQTHEIVSLYEIHTCVKYLDI